MVKVYSYNNNKKYVYVYKNINHIHSQDYPKKFSLISIGVLVIIQLILFKGIHITHIPFRFTKYTFFQIFLKS